MLKNHVKIVMRMRLTVELRFMLYILCDAFEEGPQGNVVWWKGERERETESKVGFFNWIFFFDCSFFLQESTARNSLIFFFINSFFFRLHPNEHYIRAFSEWLSERVTEWVSEWVNEWVGWVNVCARWKGGGS